MVELYISSDEGYVFTPQEGKYDGGTWDDNVNLDRSSA